MNRGVIPMETAIRECMEILMALRAVADGRTIVLDPWPLFNKYSHGRTYWGYFRDAGWLRKLEKKKYSLALRITVDEDSITRARAVRNKHRQNAVMMRRWAR